MITSYLVFRYRYVIDLATHMGHSEVFEEIRPKMTHMTHGYESL